MKKVLKRIFSFVIIASFALGAAPQNAARASAYVNPDEVIYESFDSGADGFRKDNNITVSTVEGKFGNSAMIDGFYGYQSIHKRVYLGANRSYRISYWVKGVRNYSGIQSCILMNKKEYHVNSLGAESTAQIMPNYAYAGIPAKDNKGVELTGEWQYVEDIITYSSSGMTDEVGITDIYPMLYKTGGLGAGYTIDRSYIASKKVAFCIDELKIEPLEILPGGDMSDISGYTFNDNANAYVSDEYGNKILVMTNKTGAAADMCRLADIREGEKYKISYRAKTLGGENHTQVLFTRSSGLYSKNPDPVNESVQADKVSDVWQTFTHTFTSEVETTDEIAYRYPQMIFRVKDKGTVFVDDLKIERVNTKISGLNVSGLCRAGEAVNAAFSGDGSSEYFWSVTATDSPEVLCSGKTGSESFSFTLPSGKKSVTVSVQSANGAAAKTVIDDIELYSYAVHEVSEKQTVSAQLADSVWSPDFAELRARVTVKNKAENLYGVLAVYDGDRLAAVGAERLSEGSNIITAPSDKGERAKIMVFDESLSPKIKAVSAEKADSANFIYASANAAGYVKGTYASPANLTRALAMLKNRANKVQGDIYVMLKAGKYSLSDTIKLSSDYCSADKKVTFCSYGAENDEKAVFSGEKSVSGWELYDSGKNIYRAKITDEGVTNFRQLYVNSVRAQRARSAAAPQVAEKTDSGYILNDTSLLSLSKPEDAEFIYFQEWTNPRCRIESVADNGDGTTSVKMSEKCWTQFLRKRYLEPKAPKYVENAYEFLDTPGEWYFDKSERYVYYMPREFENIESSYVCIPTVETLVSLGGTYESPIKNITFKNIGFEYSSWLYPDENGYSDAQAGKLRDRLDENGNGDDPCPDAAVEVTHADSIGFEGCNFSHLGMSALSMLWGVQNSHITGCIFGDLSGSGIYLGTPYKDSVCTTWKNDICRNIRVTDNYFHDLALDYMSCVPISTIHMYDIDISHNEIFNVPYSGIHGESGINTDRYGHKYNFNYLSRVLNDEIYDGGSIYVTGKSGASDDNLNEIRGNYIKNQLNGYAALYTDNRSSGWLLSDNVIDFSGVDFWPGGRLQWLLNIGSDRIYAENNYTTTDGINLIGDFWENEDYAQADLITNTALCSPDSWPQEAQDIISGAGLPGEYDAVLSDKYQLTLSAEKEISIKCGMSKELPLYAIGGKSGVLSADRAYVISDSPDIVGAAGSILTAKERGEGRVRIATLSDGCIKYETVKIRVY